MRPLIFALPGFLGLPKDWDNLLSQNPSILDWTSINIYSNSIRSMVDWAADFNGRVQQHSSGVQPILMGYSLGGRLAMHALLQNQKLWHAAIIISAHPGLLDPVERSRRLIHDSHWALRFENDPWEPLMQDWNHQPIFQQDPIIFRRIEREYSRHILAQILRTWSLGNQEDLLPELKGANAPILWITGAKDDHYSSLANQLILKHPVSRILSIEQAGHRVPWQQPTVFHHHLNQFLNEVAAWKQ